MNFENEGKRRSASEATVLFELNEGEGFFKTHLFWVSDGRMKRSVRHYSPIQNFSRRKLRTLLNVRSSGIERPIKFDQRILEILFQNAQFCSKKYKLIYW